MNFIYYLLLPLFFLQSDLVQKGPTKKNLTRADQDSVVRVFSVKNSAFRSSVHSKKIKNYTLMQLDTQAFRSMRTKNLEKMDFEMPFNNSTVEMELTAMQIFDQSFKVTTDQSKGRAVDYIPGKYYVGKIIGDPTSMVTLSVFDNGMSGIISSREFGNLNLGTSNPSDPGEYILYGQDEIKDQILFDCSTTETPPVAPDIDVLRPQIDKQLESRAGGCVTIDFELTYEVYTYFINNQTNSAQWIANSTNWITAMFTGVKALYLAEGIDISIKSVYVWTTEDDYSDNVSTALSTLGSRRTNDPAFTGTLVHLVRGKNCSGGCSLAGVAWLNVLCNKNYRFAVSEPIFTYSAYPAYSWSVNVLTHEMGHNMGSNHTHWCGWSGGPIDNCAAVEDGPCSAGPTPASGKGTIMSYCHQQGKPGITFANGFGPLPGAAIRARYNAVTCLSSSCGGSGVTPTCTDGIKNGTETGIDCGGTCTACVVTPTCSDGIQNGSETGVDCGGSCTACPQGCPTLTNISQGKTASQSSSYDGTTPASDAVDGSISSSSWQCSAQELKPWWQVDLGNSYQVSSIELTHRTGCTGCIGRIKKFRIFVTTTQVSSYSTAGYVYEYTSTTGLGNGQVLNIPNLGAYGRYVRIWVDNGTTANWMHFAEVKVTGCIGANPCSSNQVPTIPVVTSSQSSYPRNSSFTVNATASDPDGTISEVQFYNDGILLGADNTAPYAYTINNASASSYKITVQAIDNCNGSRTSGMLTINTTVSCSDGIQNGSETGVDCGGSCTACPQVCTSPTNISQGKTASQSSSYDGTTPASDAVDGSISSSSWQCSAQELKPWWQVDLGNSSQVSSIELTHRTGCTGCTGRIKKFRIFVTPTQVSSYSTAGYVYEYTSTTGLGNGQVLNIPNLSAFGRYVRIWVDNGTTANWMHFAEVKVMGCNGVNLCTTNEVPDIPVVTSSQSSYPRNSSFTVNATASDPDGTISEVQFYNDGILLGADNSAPYAYTISNASASSYKITVQAIDNCNGSRASGMLTINTTVSCSDGIQNGSETGVDCGGSCTACPQGCTSPTNISQGKTASQSSSYDGTTPASDAVDGSISSSSWQCSTQELKPWWQVDLGNNYQVSSIELTHRTGCTGCIGRIKKFRIFVTTSQVSSYSTAGYVYEYTSTTGLGNGQVLNIPNLSAFGRYVRIWVDNGTTANWMHFAEVKVNGCSGSSNEIVLDTNNENGNLDKNELSSKFDVQIYPNPTHDIVNLKYSDLNNDEIHTNIFDVYGRKLFESKIWNSQIDIKAWEEGSYFIHFQHRGKIIVKKIVKH